MLGGRTPSCYRNAGNRLDYWLVAGATALRGPIGFGKSSRMHTSKILRLSMDLPMIIEIVDSEEKIQSFLPVLDAMITGGLVTMEKVRALHYRGEVSGAVE